MQQQIQVSPTPYSSIDVPLPPSPPAPYASQQPLPQYVPAYREPAAYTPAPYQAPATPPVQYRMPIPTPPPSDYVRPLGPPQAAQVPIQPAQPAQPQYYYYPGYYQPPGGLNGFFEQLQCFSGDMEVETPSGTKAIKDLKVGDMVLSIDESMVTFSPVIMFLHKLEKEEAEFLQLNLESGESLELTENHLIYVTNCGKEDLRLVSAKDSKIGQCVQVTDSVTKFTPKKIISIKRQPPGGLNGFFEQLQCFSGDMKVETPSGTKAIKDLKVGDMVLSIDESMVTFSPVIMFLHKLEQERAEFLQLNLESGESLELTENHLIYVTNCGKEDLRLVSAKDSKIGQCVQVTDSVTKFTPKKIISIKRDYVGCMFILQVTGVGIYAPLTSTGDIMVNRILVSCHSNLALKTLQQTFFSVYRGLSSFLRDYIPSSFHDNVHLPLGVHYLTTVVDLFLPSSFF
ncbi:intein splicing region [Oesophagostomum dentatum]|uniref:Intein splicing region n=1 Tax=Oesophagostomum dentatum TaxID=61180 RepID=A0A0B1SX78_OESDE|nr:intein splicing region [Oesophagostomum dentatum]